MIAHRRRSALIQVLFLTTLLAAFLLILSSEARRSWTVVQDQRREQVARVELDAALEQVAFEAQYGVDSPIAFAELRDGAGQRVSGAEDAEGFFAARAADEASESLQLFYSADGLPVAADEADLRVELRSAYRTWRNDDVDLVVDATRAPQLPLPLPRVLAAERASMIEPLLDYYALRIDDAPARLRDLEGGARGRSLHQLNAVYRVEKPCFNAALYLEGDQLRVREGGLVDGRDHLDVDLSTSYYVVPFASKVGVSALPRGSAGYHHSLHYVDPTTGTEETIFRDSHSVWSGSERVEVVGAPLKDAEGDPLEVGRGAPLDFYIHSWQGNKTKHHLFGNEIYLPGSEHHGKKYGYAWNEVLVLDMDNLAAGADYLSPSDRAELSASLAASQASQANNESEQAALVPKISSLTSELSAAQSKLATARAQLSALPPKPSRGRDPYKRLRNQLKRDVNKASKSVTKLQQQLAPLVSRQAQLEQEATRLAAEQAELSAQLAKPSGGTAIGEELYAYLERTDPSLAAAIKDVAAFKADPLGGREEVATYGVDWDGDGKGEYDHDVDGNGKLNTWRSGDVPLAGYEKAGVIEDRNGNGVRDDDDRRLAEAIQSFFIARQNDDDPRNDAIDHLELVMGFEDLDVAKGNRPDWDYNDVFLILSLEPTGDSSFDDPEPPSFRHETGLTAVLRTDEAGFSQSVQTYGDDRRVRTALERDAQGELVDVFGEAAYEVSGSTFPQLREAFLAAPQVLRLTSGAGLSSLVGTADESDEREPAVVHVQNAGGAAAVLDGSLHGEGVLVVDGDLEIRDHVVWRGAIFVGGRLTLAGEPGRGVWVFGAASAASVEVGDNSHLCFSSQALQATRDLDPRLRSITTRIACWRE